MSWPEASRPEPGAAPTDASATLAEGPAPDTATGFAAWVTPHLPRMSLLAGRLVPAADRDDVVQDALLRAWRSRSSFDPDRGAPGTWLLTIVANAARSEHGRRGRRPIPAEPHHDVPDARSGAPTESSIDLERAVAALPARQRLAVDCHYFAGLTVAETAAVMGCSEGTVKSTLAAARGRLRTRLEDHDEH